MKMEKMGKGYLKEEMEIVIGEVNRILKDTPKKKVSEREKRGSWDVVYKERKKGSEQGMKKAEKQKL